ncbi:MAG: PDZ domain-containing protein, partial [Planctomycetota bacterium]|nr:PDZ domain-containing protein [Planctomycetota bacterium]
MRTTRIPLFVLALLLLPLAVATAEDAPKAAKAASPEKPAAAKAAPTMPAGWSDALTWRSIGPANMGGRITALAVYEKQPTTFWAATASGGLLKTVNNGQTFEHQFDREAVVSIGDVDIAQSDPNIVWVGTGESNPRNSVSWGNGVYKSTDGGKTWAHMGLEKSFQIGAVRVHPTNPDVVYVGALGRLWGTSAERGLYKTEDGGKTWKRVLFVDDKSGVIDVVMHPSNPDTLLVATYERQRDGFCTNSPKKRWGHGSGLWRTTDGGKTFERVTKGLPTGKIGRIGLCYSQKNPDNVFMVLESEKTGKAPADSPYLGINGENADVGSRLTNIVKEGPAAKAGLLKGDIVLGMDGERVHDYAEFIRMARRHVAGDVVKLEIVRERKTLEVELTFGKRPKGGRSPFAAYLNGQNPNLQEQQGKRGHEYGGIYRSSDGGISWTRINTLNPRPMYFSVIRVDPNNEDNLWVLGIR